MVKLPVVSEEIGKTMSEELLHEPGNDYIVRVLQELQEENPHIASFISQFSLTAGDKHASQTAAYCGLLVYKMLESQAEADELKKNLRM